MVQKQKKQVTNLQMIEVDHNKIAVELSNGNVRVNLTDMSKSFGRSKRPKNWLKSQESQDYIKALSVATKRATADLLQVKQGGRNQGTWAMDYRIAMRYAQWLSPEFSVAVDEMLVKLMKGDAVMAEPLGGVWPIISNGIVGYPRKEILKVAGYTNLTSATIKHFKKKYPHDHFLIYHIACFSPRMAKLRLEMGQMRQRRIEFDNKATQLKKGGNA